MGKYDKSSNMSADCRFYGDGQNSDFTHKELGQVFKWTQQVIYGENINGYWVRLNRGDGVTTTAEGLKVSFHLVPGKFSMSAFHNLAQLTVSEDWHGQLAVPTILFSGGSFDSSLYDRALASWVQKAREVQHRFQAGVFLGELRETIHLIRSPLLAYRRLTYDYVKRVKKLAHVHNVSKVSKRTKSFREFERKLSNEYLQYTFGIRPLIQDIDDAMYDLATLQTARPPSSPVRVLKVEKTSDPPVFHKERAGFSTYAEDTLVQKTSYEKTVYLTGKVRCFIPDASNSSYFDASTALQVGLSDFVPTIYELIPYSFLVDYFTNLGDYLSCLTFLTATVDWCSATERSLVKENTDRSVTLYTGPGHSLPPSIFSHITSASGSSQAKVIVTKWRRYAVTSFVPQLHFSLPGVGSLRWLNVAALLSQSRKL